MQISRLGAILVEGSGSGKAKTTTRAPKSKPDHFFKVKSMRTSEIFGSISEWRLSDDLQRRTVPVPGSVRKTLFLPEKPGLSFDFRRF
jgi:hypothetical protein